MYKDIDTLNPCNSQLQSHTAYRVHINGERETQRKVVKPDRDRVQNNKMQV